MSTSHQAQGVVAPGLSEQLPAAENRRRWSTTMRDLIALTKPRIVMMSTLMAGGGAALAPGALDLSAVLLALLGTGAVVGGASAVNMYLERDRDRLMPRTRTRPLASGRLNPRAALWVGFGLSAASVAMLALLVNRVTAALGLLGLVTYVLMYTPLKTRTTLSLPVGAIAGALPPLMGWTAATGAIGLPGLALFGTLFVWQVPHFMAIALFRSTEYAGAGFVTTVSTRGERAAWRGVVAYSAVLLPVSLVLPAIGHAGWLYAAASGAAGVGLVALALLGLRAGEPRWARTYFRGTLLYLPAVAFGLMLDRIVLG